MYKLIMAKNGYKKNYFGIKFDQLRHFFNY